MLKSLSVYNASELEKEIRTYWEENKIPQQMAQHRKGCKPFFLLDGPPYTNAQAHIGHVKTTACKDIWSRFKYLQGFNSFFQPGFDCHGLPTEVMVEKELGIKSKGDIEKKIGIEKFDAKCLEKAVNTEQGWINYYKLLGAWRAYFEPYFTYKDYYIESAWWTAKKLHEKGLVTEGLKPIHWCSRCETSLSGYEVSDSYKDLQAPSIFVKFKVKNAAEFLLVWTTTPWTLPANVAVAVHPEETYLRAQSGGEVFILAKKRLEAVSAETGKTFTVLAEFKGAELDGLEYEPLLPELATQQGICAGGKAHRVVLSVRIMANKKYKKHIKSEEAGNKESAENKNKIETANSRQKIKAQEVEEYEEFVTMESGSGLVHTAPGHGQSDNFLGKHYNLPVVSPLDVRGCFTPDAGQFSGKNALEADPLIIKHLNEGGKLFAASAITHRAAVCWRCKTPLLFRLSRQWYLKVDLIKEKMLGENENVRWLPEFGQIKFQNWIADREDWCLSQQRYWGIPMPFWICAKCSALHVVGSRAELIERSLKPLRVQQLQDLHRHTVDSITIRCDACAGEARRVEDIFTVWFDSGVAPWASLGYPYRNKELFESMFPVDLVNESQDQIRGWFDSLMLCGVGTFGRSPYRSVALMGWVVDEKGEKMSKSIGNVIPAEEGITKLGADATRLYFASEVAAWEVQKFSFDQARKITQALGILWNCFTFYQTYRGSAQPQLVELPAVLPVEDKWILSRLNTTIAAVTRSLENFEFHFAGRALMRFIVEDFSRTYVKLVRDRMSDRGEKKQQCIDTMYTCLYTVTKLLAPICPFLAEYLFQQLKSDSPENKLKSVHYSIYPKQNLALINLELEQYFAIALHVTEAVNAARQAVGFKLRWPIREVYITADEKQREKVEETAKHLQTVLCKFNNCESVALASQPSFDVASKPFDGGVVHIAVKRDEELILASLYRELVRAVQAARKREGLVVSDKIELFVNSSHAGFVNLLKVKKDELSAHVGAGAVSLASEGGELDASLQVGEVVISAKFSKRK